MKRLSALTGLPVICQGRRIGRLLRADLNDSMDRLSGIWVAAGLHGTRFIPAENLELLGQSAVLSDGWGERRRMDAVPLFHRAVSTDGVRLGAITGAQIDELSFRVTALELSHGLWDDLFECRQPILRYTANRTTGEVIIDPAGPDREEGYDEGRNDEGPAGGHADRHGSGNGLRRDELADRAQMEPGGQANRQLDFQ